MAALNDPTIIMYHKIVAIYVLGFSDRVKQIINKLLEVRNI